MLFWSYDYEIKQDLTSTVAIVTGANAGIGRETAKALYKAGAVVFMACRSEDRATAAIKRVIDEVEAEQPENSKAKPENLRFIKLDLFDLGSVRSCVEGFLAMKLPLNLLINNAGLSASQFVLSKEGVEETMAINHLGPFLFTMLLLPKLQETAKSSTNMVRIVNVASIGHKYCQKIDYELLKSPPQNAAIQRFGFYAVTKLANVLFTRELDRRFKACGIPILTFTLHPGTVATEIWRNDWFLSALSNLVMLSERDGALTSLYCATSADLENPELSGKYFDSMTVTEPAPQAKDDSEALKLWEWSCEKCGITDPLPVPN